MASYTYLKPEDGDFDHVNVDADGNETVFTKS